MRSLLQAVGRGLLPLLLLTSTCSAVPVLSFPTTSSTASPSLDLIAGWTFTTNSAFQINALGIYDEGLDGFGVAHEVGIWDSLGSLLASVTVPSGIGSTLIANFRYVAIAPILLAAGQTFTVGATFGAFNPDVYNFSANNVVYNPAITFGQTVVTLASPLTQPTTTVPLGDGIFGPNLDITLITPGAPELTAASAGLPLTICLLAFCLLSRRRRPAEVA